MYPLSKKVSHLCNFIYNKSSPYCFMRAPPSIQTARGHIFQCRPCNTRRIRAGRGDFSGFGSGGVRGSAGSFSTALMPQVLIRENVENFSTGGGGAVPFGLYLGDGPSSLQERVHRGTQAQLRSLLDTRLPPYRHPEVTYKVPRVEHTAPSPAPNHPNKIVQDICGPL